MAEPGAGGGVGCDHVGRCAQHREERGPAVDVVLPEQRRQFGAVEITVAPALAATVAAAPK